MIKQAIAITVATFAFAGAAGADEILSGVPNPGTFAPVDNSTVNIPAPGGYDATFSGVQNSNGRDTSASAAGVPVTRIGGRDEILSGS